MFLYSYFSIYNSYSVYNFNRFSTSSKKYIGNRPKDNELDSKHTSHIDQNKIKDGFTEYINEKKQSIENLKSIIDHIDSNINLVVKFYNKETSESEERRATNLLDHYEENGVGNVISEMEKEIESAEKDIKEIEKDISKWTDEDLESKEDKSIPKNNDSSEHKDESDSLTKDNESPESTGDSDDNNNSNDEDDWVADDIFSFDDF